MFKQYLITVVAAACLVIAPATVAESSTVASPALSGWINAVLSQNPEIQAAQAAVDAAGGRLRAADQPLFNPELEFDYENSEIDTTTGGLSQTIDWSDKRGARTAVADFELALQTPNYTQNVSAWPLICCGPLRTGTRPGPLSVSVKNRPR